MPFHSATGTNTIWQVMVTNHLAAEPDDTASNNSICRIVLNDIYSDSPPRLADAHTGWWNNMTVSNVSPGHFSVTFNCTDPGSYIPPGNMFDVSHLHIYTTVPNTNCTYRTGECFGRALTVSNSWVPDDPGQSFVGPIGIAPLSGIESLSVTSGACELAITNTSAVWQHTVERNTQMDAPESWSPCHTFSADTNRYVWTETPSNGTAFYRIKSEYK